MSNQSNVVSAEIDSRRDWRDHKFLLILIGVSCIAQLVLAFIHLINWDEFFYLSRVYEYRTGTLTGVLNNFHVHFFGWLSVISDNEVEQIRAARVVMWMFQTGTLALMYWTGRAFLSSRASLFSVLAFITAGYVMFHGASFRTDSPAVFFTMASLAIMTRTNLSWGWLVVIAVSFSLAVMFTVKSILFAPAFLTIIVWRLANSDNWKKLIFRLIGAGGLLAVCLGLLLTIQMLSLAQAPASQATAGLTDAASTTLLNSGILPRLADIIFGMKIAFLPFLVFALGTACAVFCVIVDRKNRKTALVLLGAASPLICLLLYRNAYGYFFPFIFPSAMLLVGYAIDRLKLSDPIVRTVAMMMVASIAVFYSARVSHDQKQQSELVDVVHKMFPEKVNYFDRCGMIGSFPREGLFLSSWGLKKYREQGGTMFTDILKRETVPLLIENRVVFSTALSNDENGAEALFSKADAEILRRNYIRHWGRIWVAGRHVDLQNTSVTIQNDIPGIYTLEAKHAVRIKGVIYQPNEVVMLERGQTIVRSDENQTVTLRWGRALYKPKHPSNDGDLFPVF